MCKQTRALVVAAVLGVLMASVPEVRAQTLFEGDWGVGVFIQPFAGTMDFHEDLFLDRQTITGGVLGIRLGRDVGLQGFYWRGVTDNFDKAEPIESWGAEVQLDVHLGMPVKPYLLAGGGRLEFRDDFLDPEGRTRTAENILILGGGVAWDVNRWLRLDGTARSYLMERPDLGAVITPVATDDNLIASWMVTGGFSIRVGGQPKRFQGPGAVGAVTAGNVAMVPVPETGEIRVTYGAAGAGSAGLNQSTVFVTADGDTILIGGSVAAASAVERVLDIELGYLDAIFPEYTSLEGGRQPITGERADTLERRMALRFNEIFDYLMAVEATGVRLALLNRLESHQVGTEASDRVMARADTVLDARMTLIAQHSVVVDSSEVRARKQFEEDLARRRFAAPYGGANFTNGGQFLVGGRLGLNTSWQRDRWAWVPEVALGFGSGGVSTLVQGGLQYFFASTGAVEFYGGLSAGLLVMSDSIGDRTGASFVFTPAVGITGESAELAEGVGGTAWGWFAEYQGVGFFDLNRLLVGLTWAY